MIKKVYHYVYKVALPETGEFYIGSRSSEHLPEQDPYKGSMSVWKVDKTKLIKEIVKSDFKDRFSAMKYEAFLIKQNIYDPLNRNYRIPSAKMNTYKKVIVKDSFGNVLSVEKTDPRYINGELISINKGRIFTEEHKKKISWSGKKHTLESRKKISESQIGVPHKGRTRAKKILQFSKTGELIREWNSITEAAKELKLSVGNIHGVLNERKKTTGGFRWKYKPSVE